MLCLTTIFSQNRVDTTYTLDSIWRNDTLFIVKKMHLTVIIDNNETIIDTQKHSDNKQLPVNLQPVALEPVRKKFINYNNISLIYELGFYNVVKSQTDEFLENTLTNLYSNSFGLSFDVEQLFFRYSVGLMLTNYYEKFEFNDKWNVIDSAIQTIVDINSYWEVDTFWYLNLDSLLVGDTVWCPYYDSNQIVIYDTSYKTNYDTTKYQRYYNRINKLRFIELPIIAGFNYTYKRWTFSVSSGFIFGLPIFEDYRLALPMDIGIINGYFSNISYWSYSKFDVKFRISKMISLKLGFYAKIALNNQLTIIEQKRKYNSYGLNLSIVLRL